MPQAIKGRGSLWWRRAGAIIVALLSIAAATSLLDDGDRTAQLVAVLPADDAAVAAPPHSVRLTFAAPPDPRQVHVTVTSATGVQVTTGVPRPVGRSLVIPVEDAVGGSYLVAYHVVLGDGRQASGSSRFTVLAAPIDDGTPKARIDPAGAPAAGATADGGHLHEGTDPLSRVLLLMDLILIVALVALMFRRPQERTMTDDVVPRGRDHP